MQTTVNTRTLGGMVLGILLISPLTTAQADLPFNYGKASTNYVDNTSGGGTTGGLGSLYVGGTIGSSEADGYCDGASGCNNSDTAWKVFGGYRLNENLGAELAYHNLGDIHKNGENSDVSALSANATASMRVSERFDLFGKAGAMRWNSENTGGDRDGFGFTYGVGAKMQMNENTKLRAEWEQFPGIETSATEESDINMLSVGIELSTY